VTLPFSHDAFLDVFAAFNAAWWPVVAVLWVATAWTALMWWRGQIRAPAILVLLAVHWAWSGAVYHWRYFRPINPAATVFAAGFVVQAVVFAWLAWTRRGLRVPGGRRRTLAGALVLYGLAYPLVGLATGLAYPRLPTFAVPCPTTIITAGWMLAFSGLPRAASVLPLVWAGIGSSAAFMLGISADLALVVAAMASITHIVRPEA
jgi:hypothetical protein